MAVADTPAPARRRIGFDGCVGRIALIALAALLLFEGVVRAIDWKAGRTSAFWVPDATKLPMLVPHPFLGCVLRPGYERNVDYQIRINNLGMRGADMSARKPDGVYRIFATGGSTTFCTGARSDAAAWPAQLELMLASVAPEGRKYEVGNCGVSGWTSAENLIDLELRRVEQQPDAWLFYGAANDARPVQAKGFVPDYTHIRRAWVNDESRGLDRWLLGASHAYAWITRGLDPELQQGALASKLFVPGYKSLHVRSDERVNEDGVRVYLRNVENMLQVCRGRNIQPVLCSFATCASKLKPDDERVLETIAKMNEGVREIASRFHVPFVDLATPLSDHPEWYDDWMHHNDAGCQALARTLLKLAREQRLFGLGS